MYVFSAQDCDEFFKLLALCHTVLPAKEDDKLIYNAQSPDEAALVTAAKNFGYVFLKRSPFTITIHKLSSDKEVYIYMHMYCIEEVLWDC